MRILQIACSYLPDTVGGTEVYVHSLAKELKLRGHDIFISYSEDFSERNAPLVTDRNYVFEGIPVYVMRKNICGYKTKDIYFQDEPLLFHSFEGYLKKIKPDIVHFHHFSPTDVITQMQVAKKMQLPVILTYHTPTMTCGHSDMLYLGKEACDGKIDYARCLICSQTRYHIPYFLAKIWAGLPQGGGELLGRIISNTGWESSFSTWLQFPWLTRQRIRQWESGFRLIGHFIVLCQWAYELLANNGIPGEQVTLLPQGIAKVPDFMREQRSRNYKILRLGYIGRIHPVKGIDLLLEAISLLPDKYNLELFIYGMPTQDRAMQGYYNSLLRQSCADKRIKWSGLLPQDRKFQALAELDALVIPSRWLETGPLVLLESLAVGTPVIGSRLGGIAEFIAEDKGGILFKPGDARELASIIARVYRAPEILSRLRRNIPPIRTTQDLADDMENLYNKIKRG